MPTENQRGSNHCDTRIARAPLLVVLVVATLLPVWIFSLHPRITGLIGNSMLLACGACCIALPLGMFLGFAIFRTNLPGRRILLWLVISSMFIPLYVHAAAWSAGFGQLGWFPLLGETSRPLLEGWRGAVWVHAMAAIPWVTLIIGSAARNTNATLEEVALLDASPATVLLRVTLPAILPAMVAAVLWTTLMTTGEMTVTDIFRVRTYVEEVYLNSQLDQFSSTPPVSTWASGVETYTVGLAGQILVAVLFTLVAIALIMLYRPDAGRGNRSLQFDLQRWRWPISIAATAIVALMIGLPIMNLIYKSGAQNIPHDGWNETRWSFELLFENIAAVRARYGVHFQWSAAITLLSATLAMAVSLPLVWLARKGKFPGVIPAALLGAIGAAVPGPTIAILLIRFFDQPDSALAIFLYDDTLLAPVLAIVIRIAPLTLLFCWQLMRGINQAAFEDAELVGVSRLRRFWMFGIVQRRFSIAAGFLMAAVFAAGDLTASNLVMPPGVDPLPRRVFGLIHSGVDDQVAVLSLSSVLVAAPMIGLFLMLLSLSEKSE